jgi:RNA polymerase sigma factor (sigma-70 family)
MSIAMAARDRLDDKKLYGLLSVVVRRKVPAADVEDLVQSTLADALGSAQAPSDEDELRRWVFGIARNKIADYYRHRRREVPQEPPDLELAPGSRGGKEEPHSARDLLRWAEEALPENDAAKQTFDWMLREGQGEKLEAIAEEEKLPAPQVRKRVSRLRQHLKRMWAVELGAVAVIALAFAIRAYLARREPQFAVHPDSAAVIPALERAAAMRKAALERCKAGDARQCLDGLDRAREVDRDGDAAEEIQRAREIAIRKLDEGSLPAARPSSSPAPSTTPAPRPSTGREKAPRLPSLVPPGTRESSESK